MNLRQKAKHFKKLYVVAPSQTPYLVIYKPLISKHYKIQSFMDSKESNEPQTKIGGYK